MNLETMKHNFIDLIKHMPNDQLFKRDLYFPVRRMYDSLVCALAENVKVHGKSQSVEWNVVGTHLDLLPVEKGGIWITPKRNIPLKYCNTSEKVLGCVFELSLESWIDRDMIHRFVLTASDYFGIDLS